MVRPVSRQQTAEETTIVTTTEMGDENPNATPTIMLCLPYSITPILNN